MSLQSEFPVGSRVRYVPSDQWSRDLVAALTSARDIHGDLVLLGTVVGQDTDRYLHVRWDGDTYTEEHPHAFARRGEFEAV